jgi:hypothetical protein
VSANPDPDIERRREYCSLLVRCALTPPAEACPADVANGLRGVAYDEVRCREARQLAAEGVSPEDAASYSVYRFLGKRHRVTYAVAGDLPITAARLSFLLDDLPLAAKLLTTFSGRRYSAEYLDEERRRFRGSKQGTLRGEASRLAGASSEGRLVYFGFGSSKVGFWRLGGQSLATLEFEPLPAPASGVAYSLVVLVTPDSAFLNRIMNLGLFRGIVVRQVREVLEDIDGATRSLARQGLQSGGVTWTPEEQARLREFLALP